MWCFSLVCPFEMIEIMWILQLLWHACLFYVHVDLRLATKLRHSRCSMTACKKDKQGEYFSFPSVVFKPQPTLVKVLYVSFIVYKLVWVGRGDCTTTRFLTMNLSMLVTLPTTHGRFWGKQNNNLDVHTRWYRLIRFSVALRGQKCQLVTFVRW